MNYIRKTSDGTYEVRIAVLAALRERIGKSALTRRRRKTDAVEAGGPVIARFKAILAEARESARDVSNAMSTSQWGAHRSETVTILHPRDAVAAIDRWKIVELEKDALRRFNEPSDEPDRSVDAMAWIGWNYRRDELRNRLLDPNQIEEVDGLDENLVAVLA